MESPIRNFTDLRVWQEGHTFVLAVYKVTRKFPKEELFGLITRLRRAVVSVTSNIAEGFCRFSYKDKANFYAMSLGSLAEVQNQLLISRDLGYLSADLFDSLAKQTVDLSKMLNGLIKKSRTRDS